MKTIKILIKEKRIVLFALLISMMLSFALLSVGKNGSALNVLAATSNPEAGNQVEAATVEPTEEPTPTPSYLVDFTPPPAEYEIDENAYIEEQRAKAEKSKAAAGIVQIEDIESERRMQLYDIVRYLSYAFFAIAGIVIVYGVICIGVLIFFKKDISIEALRKKRRAKKKKEQSGN